MDLRYIYKPGEYNCQMNKLMFQAGPRCKRNERVKRAHSLYYSIDKEWSLHMCKHVHTSKFHIYTFSDNLNRFLHTVSLRYIPNLNRTFVLVYLLSDH